MSITWRVRLAALAFITSCLVSFSVANAQPKRIAWTDLPRPVQTAVDQESKGATIRSYSVETDQGSKVYDVELVADGRSKDVSLDAKGNILQVEQEISMDSLPVAAQETLAAAAGNGVIDKIKSLTKRGALLAYEALVKTGTQSSRILIAPEGKRLDAID